MKEKIVGLLGTVLGIGGYLLLKIMYENLGLGSFMAILASIATIIVLAIVLSFGFSYISEMMMSPEEKEMRKQLIDEMVREELEKQKEESTNNKES